MSIDGIIKRIIRKPHGEPKNIEQLMLPITISGWMLGLGIVEFPLGNHWPIASLSYTIILTLTYSYLAKISIDNIEVLFLTSTVAGKIVFKGLFYGNVFLNICGPVLSWMRMKDVKNIQRRLDAFDKKMDEMGMTRDYAVIYYRQLLALSLHAICIFVFLLVEWLWSELDGATSWQKLAGAIATYYPVILVSAGDLSFVTFVRFVALRFEQLNKFLLTMSTTSDVSPQHKRVLEYTRGEIGRVDLVFDKRTRDDSNVMRAARDYHHELVKIASFVNETFGIQALLSMTVSFALITGLLYTTCGMLLSSTESQRTIDEELVNSVCWLFFYIYRIILINAACATASDAARKTSNIICHLHEPSTKKAYRDEIRDFTLQMTQHSLTFTACGFFTLNYRLVQRMIGSITTYLVILIQISEMPSSENSTVTAAPWPLDYFNRTISNMS